MQVFCCLLRVQHCSQELTKNVPCDYIKMLIMYGVTSDKDRRKICHVRYTYVLNVRELVTFGYVEKKMNKNIEIRLAQLTDAEALLEIYRYYVEHTAISFEYAAPDGAEFQKRMEKILSKYPYLVAVEDGHILGYAYAGAFHERAAYEWAAEVTIYLAPDAKKCGIGRKLYEELEKRLQQMGITNLYACIGYPEQEDEYLNQNSAQFHAHMGYQTVGTFHNCGYKFQRWYHMIWMEKIIGVHVTEQPPVKYMF